MAGHLKRGEVIAFIGSVRFTVYLMICLAVIFIAGLAIPQQDMLGPEMYGAWKVTRPGIVAFLEALRLTDIYYAPFTYAVWGAFFLNLLLVMARRIPVIVRKCFDIRPFMPPIGEGGTTADFDAADMEMIQGVLRSMRYRVFEGEGAFRAVKNRFSPLATILFHLSFLLLLIGGVTSLYWKFTAETHVAAGETFDGDYRNMRRPKFGGIPDVQFTLESVAPTYYDRSVPVELDVVLSTPGGKERIGINKPFKKGAVSFVITDIDVAPLFIIRGPDGRELDGAYVKLKVLKGGGDSFEMLGYRFETRFYTDADANLADPFTDMTGKPQALRQTPEESTRQQPEIVRPAVAVTAARGGDMLAGGLIRPGESVRFDDKSIQFQDYAYWVGFYVVRDISTYFVYPGFIIMTIALIVRFVFYRRDIAGQVTDSGKLRIAGSGEYFRALFEEEFGRFAERVGSMKGG